MDWFLYDNGLRHERVKKNHEKIVNILQKKIVRAEVSELLQKSTHVTLQSLILTYSYQCSLLFLFLK